jgi:uncharacterized membrane protein
MLQLNKTMPLLLTKKSFYTFITCIIFVFTGLNLLQLNNYFVYSYTFLFLMSVPGILLLILLRVPFRSFWESSSLCVGLSLFFIMVGGLITNQVLPQVGITHPLSLQPIIFSFSFFLLLLTGIAYFFTSNMSIPIKKIHVSQIDLSFSSALILFPLLAIMGSISLNSGGSNIFGIILLGGIGIYTLLLIIFSGKISKALFPSSLYFIGLSLLFMTSLRSNFITGYDVHWEYYVFQLTKTHHLWNIDFYKDAYNACLSITILPTILSDFLRFNDMYIYKVIFQILFAFCPVTIYLFIKKYTTSVFAFIATFYFISFPTFFNDMPALTRQEIGFMFFSLLILVTFSLNLPKFFKSILFLILGFGVIISHYSTNYALLFLFLFAYIARRILSIPKINSILTSASKALHATRENGPSEKPFISGFLLICLFILTFLWNSKITQTSNNFVNVLDKTVSSIFIHSSQDAKSGEVGYSLFFSAKVNPQQELNTYIATSIKSFKTGNQDDYYDKSTYGSSPFPLIPQAIVPLTTLGKMLVIAHSPVFDFQELSRQIIAKLIQILVFIGLFVLIYFKSIRKIDNEYLLICIGGIVLLGLTIVLPELSLEYGILRVFQQLLVFYGLPILVALLFILRLLKTRKSVLIAATITLCFFLTLTGFFCEITGGYYPQLTLDNAGLYYDSYYMHISEASSAKWLDDNIESGASVEADPLASTKLFTLVNSIYIPDQPVIPQLIEKSAYVYADFADVQGREVVSVDKSLIIQFPTYFLNNNKNLVYNDGYSKIYK